MTEATRKLEKRLRRDLRHFTLNDAAAATGLSIDESRDALEGLVEKYHCRLQVTENGDLIYNFGDRLRRRDAKTARDYLRSLREALWKVYVFISKSWIAITLVFYFVFFLVILLAVLIGRGAAGGDGDRRRGGRAGIPIDPYIIARLFQSIFGWRTHTSNTRYRTDRHGYRYREYEPKPSVLKRDKKNFIASVYDFVFGPERVEPEALANQKEAASYIRENRGLLVTSEIVGLTGYSYNQAEDFMTDLLIRYNGDAKVSDNGVLYVEFDELQRGTGKVEGAEIVHYWDEFEPDYPLTGNSPGRDALIAFFNGFNLVFAFLILSGALANWVMSSPNDLLYLLLPLVQPDSFFVSLFLGWLPFIFSSAFFITPAMRYFRNQRRRQHRRYNNIRKRLLKVIFTRLPEAETETKLRQAVNESNGAAAVSPELFAPVLQETTLDLRGETFVSEQAEVMYSFRFLRGEIKDAGRLRQQRLDSPRLGRIIMDSD